MENSWNNLHKNIRDSHKEKTLNHISMHDQKSEIMNMKSAKKQNAKHTTVSWKCFVQLCYNNSLNIKKGKSFIWKPEDSSYEKRNYEQF